MKSESADDSDDWERGKLPSRWSDERFDWLAGLNPMRSLERGGVLMNSADA